MMEPKDQYQELRNKLDQHPFELPQQSWEQMADILDGKQPVPSPATRGRSRRRAFLWLCFAGLLLGGLWLGAGLSLKAESKVGISALPIPRQTINGASISDEAKERAAEAAPTSGAAPFSGKSLFRGGKFFNSPPAAPPAELSPLPARPPQLIPYKKPMPHKPIADATGTIPSQSPADKKDGMDLPFIASTATAQLPLPETALEAEGAKPAQLPRWRFGLKAGVDANQRQATALVGGFARFRLSSGWTLQAELQYKTRSEERGQGLGISQLFSDTTYGPRLAAEARRGEQVERIHFLELPVSVMYRLSPRLQLLAGGQLVYLRNQAQQAESLKNDSFAEGANIINSSTSYMRRGGSPGLTRFDAGLLAGLDYHISPALSVDLRYVQGLFDLTHDPYYLEQDDYLNSSLQLSIKWIW